MVNSPAHQPSDNLPSSSRGLPEHLATSLKSCLLKRKGKLYFTSVSQKAGVLPRGGLGALALRASENAHADPRGSEARAPACRPSPARDSPLPLRWPEAALRGTTIKGSSVELSSPQVKKPRYARYGWYTYMEPNLVNADGLPTQPYAPTK